MSRCHVLIAVACVLEFLGGAAAQDVLDKGTSGIGNHGTLAGTAVLDARSRHGARALYLPPGDANHLSLTQPAVDLDIASGGYTYMCWFRQLTAGQKGLIGLGNCCAAAGGGDNRNGYTMNITSTPTIRYWAGTTPVDQNHNLWTPTTPAINDGMWHHCAIRVRDVPDEVQILFDGIQVATSGEGNIPTAVSRASPTALSNFVPKSGGDGISESSTAETLIDEVRVYARFLNDLEVVDAMNNVGPAPELLYYDFERGLDIVSVDTAPTSVVAGQTGITVDVEITNFSSSTVDTLSVALDMSDSMMTDVTSEYTITPDPANPTLIAAGTTETFTFTVDVGLMPTTGLITLDASASGIDQATMTMTSDSDAATRDQWDVLPPMVFVRTVDVAVTEAFWCETGLTASVAIENVGALAVDVTAVDLVFLAGAVTDVTSEYTITPAPGNPIAIAAGATESFDFTFDVGTMPTTGLVTIDATFSGTDSVTMAPVVDGGADTPDTMTVHACGRARLCGDCDGNGTISILDALRAAQIAAALVTPTPCTFSSCNVQGALEPDPAAAVTILDALLLAQDAAGLMPALACC